MGCDTSSSDYNLGDGSCWLDVLLNYGNPTVGQKEAAFKYARHNFMDIIKNDNFLQLDMESFKTLLRPNDLNVTSENIVFDCVKRWLDFNMVNPLDSLDSLLEVVRLPYVTPEYLVSDVLPYSYPITSCQTYMDEALRWHLFPNQRSKISSPRTVPRALHQQPKALSLSVKRVLAVGSTAFNTSAIFELYDYDKNSWTALKRLSINKRNYAAAMVNDELLLIGGFDGKATNSVMSVNLANGSVTDVSPLNATRFNFWATVVGEGTSAVVYVAGGHGVGVLNGVEKWDCVSRQWTRLANMRVARECCGLAHLDGYLYAAGGKNGNTFYKSLEVYDINTNVWQMKSDMNHIRSFCTLAASKDYVFALGGHNNRYGIRSAIKSVERYDPKTNVWTTMANISSAGIVGATEIGNKIFVAGGFTSNISEEYGIESNQSRQLAHLKFARDIVTIIPLTGSLSDYKFDW